MATPPGLKRKRGPSDAALLDAQRPSVRLEDKATVEGTTSVGHQNAIAIRLDEEMAKDGSLDLKPALQHSHAHVHHEEIHNANHSHIDQTSDLSDDDDNDDDASAFLEDAVDEIELELYRPASGDSGAMSAAEASKLREHLREVGVEQFFGEVQHMNMRKLGSAFGIDPALDISDDLHLKILLRVLVREYMRRQKLPDINTIDDVARLLTTSRNVIVITGAGISTSLGIPDFRSHGTGFYDKIREMGYEGGEDVFDIEMFDHDPSVFYTLAGDILPDQKRFTPTHAFLRLLQDKERLQTNYTQNIDNLEALAGVAPDKLIQCHGSFATATCRKCKHRVPGDAIFPEIRARQVARCKRCIETLAKASSPSIAVPPRRKKHRDDDDDDDDVDDDIPTPGVMKPDITFFGEQLPARFFERFTDVDAARADLVLVIGTSLQVAPVSDMCNHVPPHVPQVYISREPVEHHNFDVQLLGDCDTVVSELVRRAGWELKHEMIPDGLAVDVSPLAESGHRWHVRERGKERKDVSHQAAHSSQEKMAETTFSIANGT